MNPVLKFNFEGFDIFVYQTHQLLLYVEDEMMGELIEVRKNNLDWWFQPLPNTNGLFSNEEKFYDELYLRHQIREGRNWEEVIRLFVNDDLFIYRKINKKLNELLENTEYQDNLRLARIGNLEEEKEYDRKLNLGCCGFCDEIIEVDDIKYKIGFNYGH